MSDEAHIPPSPYEIGQQALAEGRLADALHAFEQAYHLNPHDPRLHLEIGKLYYAQGNLRRAREYLQYSLHLDPRSPEGNYRLALVALQDGHTAQAVQLLRAALDAQPDHEAARRTLESEEDRARVSHQLPTWQPERDFGDEATLHPPRQVGPDGKDRPAPLRAPHHCVNCYYRAGRHPRKMYAFRYRWWNLGLVGMVFGGWIVYLIWTLVVRERKFSFEPLYCPVCNQNRSTVMAAFWVLMLLAPVFGVTGLIAISIMIATSADPVWWAIPISMFAAGLVCVLLAMWARSRAMSQAGVRLRAIGDEDAGFSFLSPQYAEAFSELNGAFARHDPVTDEAAEAESFLLGADDEDADGEQPEPDGSDAAPADHDSSG